jgi:hypothetical protein
MFWRNTEFWRDNREFYRPDPKSSALDFVHTHRLERDKLTAKISSSRLSGKNANITAYRLYRQNLLPLVCGLRPDGDAGGRFGCANPR